MTTEFDKYLARAKRLHGERLDTSELFSQFVHYYRGSRIRVRSASGFERTGTVSTTTGWRPAFMLVHRSNDTGSWDLLRADDKVIAVQVGRDYRPT